MREKAQRVSPFYESLEEISYGPIVPIDDERDQQELPPTALFSRARARYSALGLGFGCRSNFLYLYEFPSSVERTQQGAPGPRITKMITAASAPAASG